MNINELGITIIVAIASIILGALITRHYSARRVLDMVIPSYFDALDLRHIAKEKIRVLYQGKPVESLSVIRVVLHNQGNSDIVKNMVKNHPMLFFGDLVKLIDVQPVYSDKETNVEASINEEKYVIFKIDFLQRRKMVAFQILAYLDKRSNFNPGDITLEPGIIENTDTRMKNLLSTEVYGVVDRFLFTIDKIRKPLTYFLMTLGGLFIITSLLVVLSLLFPNIGHFLGFFRIGEQKPYEMIISALLLFLPGISLMLLMNYIFKRDKYTNIFFRGK